MKQKLATWWQYMKFIFVFNVKKENIAVVYWYRNNQMLILVLQESK